MNNLRSGLIRVNRQGLVNVFDAQRGASLVEFSIVGLSVILVGLFTLQIGLLYHAKTTLNYAVFEAARSGAVNNASINAIRDELGFRLAPLQGGDGSKKRALFAVSKSTLTTNDPLNTKVVILNPTKAAFKDWSVLDPVSGERFIPVNHLRHQTYAVGANSGLSLRDANLLKLQVTHGVDLRVPVVGKLMTGPMKWIDTENAAYYLRDKWPIQSVATVRMQSDSFESEILKSASIHTQTGNDGSGETGDDDMSDSTDGTRNDTPGDLTQGSEQSPDDDQSKSTENPVIEVETNREGASQPEEESLAQTPATSHCDEFELPDVVVANSAESADLPHGLISTSRFRKIMNIKGGL